VCGAGLCQERTKLKQQFRNRQNDWTQWTQSTSFGTGVALPPTGNFVGPSRYTQHTLDVHQRAPDNVSNDSHRQSSMQASAARTHLMELQAATQRELDRRGSERMQVPM
jgi:hypothetical protein